MKSKNHHHLAPIFRAIAVLAIIAVIAVLIWYPRDFSRTPSVPPSSVAESAADTLKNDASQPTSSGDTSSVVPPVSPVDTSTPVGSGNSSGVAVSNMVPPPAVAGNVKVPAINRNPDPLLGRPAVVSTRELAGGGKSVASILKNVDMTDSEKRASVVAEMRALEEAQNRAVEEKARALGIPIRKEEAAGKISVIHDFHGDEPLYRTTLNTNAAISTGANLLAPAPYNLSGVGIKVGVWEIGSVRTSHQELIGRITVRDNSSNFSPSNHATHVAGTIAASGVDAGAKGMAPQVAIDSYSADMDLTEMTDAGAASAGDANRIGISNHSYGVIPSPNFASVWENYPSDTESLDAVTASLPYYLRFQSSGNFQGDPVTASFPGSGYGTLVHEAIAKNILTIGAVEDAVSAGNRSPAAGTITSFSSFGPCRDGRIKPDLVANGSSVYSSVATSDSAYATNSGTSMSSPNAAGSAALLAQLYAREFSGLRMRASTMKALLIHTADDLGNAGPDYKYGWGLINVKAAADLILAHKAIPTAPKMVEGTLTSGSKVNTHTFVWDGVSPIRATMCWTDPAGTPNSSGNEPAQTHNLDVKITAPNGITVNQPFVMPYVGNWSAASISSPAVTGKNNVDTVEQVYVASPSLAGNYTITVSLDGNLSTGSQVYSLIVSGTGANANPPPQVAMTSPAANAIFLSGETVAISAIASDSGLGGLPGAVTSVEFLSNGISLGVDTSVPYSIPWTPVTSGSFSLVAKATDNQGAIMTSAPVHVDVLSGDGRPVVSSFTPTSGPEGSSVVISGTNFAGIASVKFNGLAASFTINSFSQITAQVPDIARKGYITVTNSYGTGKSSTQFTPVFGNYFSGGFVSIPEPNTQGNASPYPSMISVSGLDGTVSAVRVRINGLTHTYPDDFDVFLVSPSGRVAAVLSDVGHSFPISGVDLVFDDAAASLLPDTAAITAGTYRPTDYEPGETLPPGATGSIGTSLTALATGGVNGDWKLFITDDANTDAGFITSWSLEIETELESSDFATVFPLLTDRAWHTATQLGNGEILVVGGQGNGGLTDSAELYDPASGTWTTVGSLNTARRNHTATLLPNGKVLVVGGDGSSGKLGSTELYDPVSGTWSPAASLVTARSLHCATFLNNGKILVSGGNGAGNIALAGSELYDPATGNWTTTGGFGTGRQSHAATLLSDGKVLVTGGFNGNYLALAHLYNPATGVWTNAGVLSSARSGHTATLLPTDRVLIAGGTTAIPLTSSELYDPASGTFSNTGSLATARAYHTATLLPNGKVFVACGYGTSHLASTQLYDSVNGTWQSAGSFGTAHASHTATLLTNGKVLVVGGGNSAGFSAVAEIYGSSTGNWTTSGQLNVSRTWHTATQLSDGRVLVAGGFGNGFESLASAEIYNPITGIWSATGSMKYRRSQHTATLLQNGKVLVAGGVDLFSNGTLFSAEIYDPATGIWSEAAPLAPSRYNHTATLLPNGKVLVTGGGDDIEDPLFSAALYDPTTGTWASTGSLSVARYSHTATLLLNGKVLVAGGIYDMTSVEIYDPVAGTWTVAAPLAVGRRDHSATHLPDGKVMVCGGRLGQGSGYTQSVEIYNPISNTWQTVSPLAKPRSFHAATLLPSGEVLITGGSTPFGFDTPYVMTGEIFDPSTGKWKPSGTLSAGRSGHTSSLLLDGRILVTGGNDETLSAEFYDSGSGFSSAWQPTISSASINNDGKMVLAGIGFRGVSEASGGNGSQDSPTNSPVVQLRSLESGHTAFVLSDPTTQISNIGFTSARIPFFGGHGLVTVFSNGIPSRSVVVSLPTPADIMIVQPLGTIIPDGGARNFNATSSNQPNIIFTIRNPGGLNLNGLAVTKTGSNSGDFLLMSPPAGSVPPGGNTTFSVKFAPANGGLKSATFHIASNVAGKNPYDINFSGRLLNSTTDTDGDGMSDASEFNMAALGFDWNASQPALVNTYQANANEAGYYSLSQVQALHTGTPLISRNPTTGKFKLTMDWKKSTNLADFFDFPAPANSVSINPQGDIELEFISPDNAAFFRVEVE